MQTRHYMMLSFINGVLCGIGIAVAVMTFPY